MKLAGKYQGVTQAPSLYEQLNQQLNILQTHDPNSREAMQAMVLVSELQNKIKGSGEGDQ